MTIASISTGVLALQMVVGSNAFLPLQSSRAFQVPAMQLRHVIGPREALKLDKAPGLTASSDAEHADDEQNEDVVQPGKMRVSEMKAELDMRGVTYADCFDRESLEIRLVAARVSGRANPNLVDQFNKQRVSYVLYQHT
jgi:hypothetical protein